MTTLYEGAYAKINLTLDVLGKRPDGYHDIKSVMQTISLRDDIQIDLDTGKPWSIVCDKDDVPTDESNLCWKAAKLFFDTVKKDPNGLTITITKRIPMEAGLGGGSADAAAVLRALNRHYNAPLSLPALAELGAGVGSDVPFCVLCGTAVVEGRGEQIRKLPDMPECIFVVCKPAFSVSTPELYAAIDEKAIANHPDTAAMETRVLKRPGPLSRMPKPMRLQSSWVILVLATISATTQSLIGYISPQMKRNTCPPSSVKMRSADVIPKPGGRNAVKKVCAPWLSITRSVSRRWKPRLKPSCA